VLPPWSSDALSLYFEQAEHNERVFSLACPDVYDFLRRVDGAFAALSVAVENDNNDARLLPRISVVRVRSSFLAALRLGMSGQMPEAFCLIRSVIETSWYALHIARDPKVTQRAECWLRRNETDDAKRRCKQEFTISRVVATHRNCDSVTAGQLHTIYERTIDAGAHPNQFGAMGSMMSFDAADQITYSVGILYPAQLQVLFTVKTAAEAAIGGLKVFAQIFPERFRLVGLDENVESLVSELNVIFLNYREASSGPSAA